MTMGRPIETNNTEVVTFNNVEFRNGSFELSSIKNWLDNNPDYELKTFYGKNSLKKYNSITLGTLIAEFQPKNMPIGNVAW